MPDLSSLRSLSRGHLVQGPPLLLPPLALCPVAFAWLVRHPGDAPEDGDSERPERPPAVRAPCGRRDLADQSLRERLLWRHERLATRLPPVAFRVRADPANRVHDARLLSGLSYEIRSTLLFYLYRGGQSVRGRGQDVRSRGQYVRLPPFPRTICPWSRRPPRALSPR
jgi:hypothetical protein